MRVCSKLSKSELQLFYSAVLTVVPALPLPANWLRFAHFALDGLEAVGCRAGVPLPVCPQFPIRNRQSAIRNREIGFVSHGHLLVGWASRPISVFPLDWLRFARLAPTRAPSIGPIGFVCTTGPLAALPGVPGRLALFRTAGPQPPLVPPDWVRFAHFALRRLEAVGRRAGVPPPVYPQSAIETLALFCGEPFRVQFVITV